MPETVVDGSAMPDGRYALGDVIGRGGMAEVYRAWDRVLERPVAVKMLNLATSDASARTRFEREALTLAKLSHPGLVTVLDAGTIQDRPFLVMELVDGAPLSDWVRDGGLDPRYVAAVGAQVADALRYVHGEGIVHRDVTPGNILLARNGRVLLADFGIARIVADTAPLTSHGVVIGTAAYLSPEQVRGTAVEPPADVYSLGLTLLEALTGTRAYPAPAMEAALARLSAAPAIPEDLPAPWPDLLHRMTALDPPERPTAGEVATTLAQAGRGLDASAATTQLFARPTRTRPVAAPEPTDVVPANEIGPAVGVRAPRPWRARPAVIAASIVVVLVTVIAAILYLAPGPQPGTADIPPGLPPQIAEDLRDLHEAVNG